MKEFTFEAEQLLPRPRDEVFAFRKERRSQMYR
jgi:hypothetical protein